MTDPIRYDGTRVGSDDARRRRLLDAAVEILATAGTDALSVRALADAVGASTKVIYTYFGGKDGVISALYDDGFEQLADQLAAAATGSGSPANRIRRTIAAYRAFALANPRLYELMYSPQIRDLRPDPADRAAAAASLAVLAELLETTGVDGMESARNLWAAAHGVISLELVDWFDPAEGAERFEQVVALHVDTR